MNNQQFTSPNLGQALAAGAAMTVEYERVWDAIWRQPYVPAAVLELCRLRLAQLLGASTELTAQPGIAIDPAKVDVLLNGDYSRDAGFSAGELAALEFTEIYAQDPQALTDELADNVKRHFDDPGLVCLIKALGFIEGRIRLALMFSAVAAA